MRLTLLLLLVIGFSANAYKYQIISQPEGTLVKNILTNQVLGITPIQVEVSNSDAGSTFGLSMHRHENVAIKIFTVQPNAENNFAVAGPDVATMALPGKSPLKVTNDANASVVYLELRPFMSEPALNGH